MQIYKVLIKNTDYSRGIDYTITSSTCNIFIKKELALKFAHDKANEFYKLYNEKNCNNEEPIYGINQYYLNFYDSTYDIIIQDGILDLDSDCILKLTII